jgi:hypothetical protein
MELLKLKTEVTLDTSNISDETIAMFEKLWIEENVGRDYNRPSKELPDNQYAIYKAWAQFYSESLYAKHLPNTTLISGSKGSTKVIFHGGCLQCSSQSQYGIERCFGCLYFKFDRNKKDLSIK